MKIEAKIICDSVGPNGVRLTTFVIIFPRFILPEFNTHRAFSRNGASSRAIPISKQLEIVKTQPFIPKHFNKNAKGMQGAEIVDENTQKLAEEAWLKSRDEAIKQAEVLNNLDIAKQYSNRLLEPFLYTTMVVTATEYNNFFALRHHSAAQPEIAKLAELMWEEYKNNKPNQLVAGQWHLPFLSEKDSGFSNEEQIKISVARCARVSYNNHDGTNSSLEQDLKLYARLLGQQPIHASPAEHQAQCLPWPEGVMRWSANFRGWLQYRQTLKDQNITSFEGPLG